MQQTSPLVTKLARMPKKGLKFRGNKNVPHSCGSDNIIEIHNLTSGVPPLGAVTPDIGQFKSEAKSVAIFKAVHTVKTI